MGNRKSFKCPPAVLTSTAVSQAARRTQALEEQRRRREQRYDSTRQLDVLANLNLGLSDDEQDDEDNADIVRDGISQFAAMLAPPTSSEPLPPRNQKRSKKRKSKRKVASKNEGATETTPNKRLKSHWADKCMYAELLEMKPEASWDRTDCGLPDDLESNWIAVSGVPVGKRCLAITYHSSGVAGSIPNTILRSRVVGKHLLPPFPSILPSNTVLDCILDEKWQQNGILHVLDVLKWKGQDIADCEAAFRFWWRDTRMSELSSIRSSPVQNTPSSSQLQLNFPYPTSFIPIPYHPDTSLSNLMSTIIPLARSPRIVSIVADSSSMSSESMQVDAAVSDTTIQVEIKSEGLLLYVSQATYEPSTSPLSSWIPSVSEDYNALDLFETSDLSRGGWIANRVLKKWKWICSYLSRSRLTELRVPATHLPIVMVDLELDAPLETPPLKPPLANSSSPKDNEPDDLDKIRKWQEERLSRKLRGEYESAVLHLNEVIENNSSTPLNVAAVRVEGATHTRQSFLGFLVKPHLPNHFTHDEATLQSVLLKARDIGHTLQATDLFKSVYAVIEPSRDPLAAAQDVDLVFKTKEKGRLFLKTSTEFGNSEGSASIMGRVRNVFGGAEVLEGQLAFGTQTRRSFHASLSAPLTPSLSTHGILSVFGMERDNTSYASCSEALRGVKAIIRNNSTSRGHEYGYEAVARHLGNLTPTASMSLRHAAGSSIKSSVFHNWTRDSRDDKITANKGVYLKLSQELAGLGGDASFYKAESETQLSRKIFSNLHLSFAARTGVLWSLFSPTYFSDRFQLGGPTSVRMFRNNGMGPRDGSDSLGGELYWSAGLSLISDIPRRPNWPVKTHLFLNSGRLDNIDRSKSLITNIRECVTRPSISAGVGLVYKFDPIRVEVNFGVPLVASKSDGYKRGFEVGIGINFL